MEREPRSEATWTALADLSLLASALGRDHPEVGRPLVEAMRAALDIAWRRAGELPPGPEQWAAHVAATWLDPAAHRARLQDPGVRTAFEASQKEALRLGPAWRPEEVAHVRFKLGAEREPPRIRPVALDAGGRSLYELTHVAYFCTDFGAVRPAGARDKAIAAQLSQQATSAASLLAQGDWLADDWIYDLGVELVLAASYLTGAWPKESLPWITRIMPERARRSLALLQRDPGAFIGLYHLLAVTAVGLARAATTPAPPAAEGACPRERTERDEGIPRE